MTDEDYVAELRSHGMLSTNQAADRIEQLTSEAAKMLAEQDSDYNRKTNDMIERHAEQVKALTAERDRLREDLEELDFLRHEGGPDSVAAIEAERDRLREALAAVNAKWRSGADTPGKMRGLALAEAAIFDLIEGGTHD